jgi:hemin uptake protein HemP
MVASKGIQSNNQGMRRMLADAQPRAVSSHELLMGAREIRIAHGEDIYRLTVTRQGKLILTK